MGKSWSYHFATNGTQRDRKWAGEEGGEVCCPQYNSVVCNHYISKFVGDKEGASFVYLNNV